MRAARVARAEFGAPSLRMMVVERALGLLPPFTFMRLRTGVYRACGVRIGKGSAIISNITISGDRDAPSRLYLGAGCVLNGPTHLDLNATITIGDRVHIGHHVVMITTEHEVGGSDRRCGTLTLRPIVIGDGAWIGAHSTLGPGVSIGKGAVVAMGSIVTSDVPPNKLVGGNPARPIKTLVE
jgi:maltose O-acetyltransferase